MNDENKFVRELKPDELEYRMYCLVLRQLNGINKGIQSAHACLEYANLYKDEEDYKKYIEHDKTMIMLDGGTEPDLNNIIVALKENKVKHAFFKEPDLGDIVTSVVFLADERVWDNLHFKSYQSFYNYFFELYATDFETEIEPPTYDEWLEHIGGKQNEIIIETIQGKRLSI